jgi:hypothetical protein
VLACLLHDVLGSSHVLLARRLPGLGAAEVADGGLGGGL